jgi:hypothetical protein
VVLRVTHVHFPLECAGVAGVFDHAVVDAVGDIAVVAAVAAGDMADGRSLAAVLMLVRWAAADARCEPAFMTRGAARPFLRTSTTGWYATRSRVRGTDSIT